MLHKVTVLLEYLNPVYTFFFGGGGGGCLDLPL